MLTILSKYALKSNCEGAFWSAKRFEIYLSIKVHKQNAIEHKSYRQKINATNAGQTHQIQNLSDKARYLCHVQALLIDAEVGDHNAAEEDELPVWQIKIKPPGDS